MPETVQDTVTPPPAPVAPAALPDTEAAGLADSEAIALASWVSKDIKPEEPAAAAAEPEKPAEEPAPVEPDPVAPPAAEPADATPEPEPAAAALQQGTLTAAEYQQASQPDPAVVQQQQQAEQAWQQRVTAYEQRMNAQAVKQAAPGFEFDPYTDGKEVAWLQLEGERIRNAEMQHLRAQAEHARRLAEEQQQWSTFAAANPGLSLPKVQAAWQEEYAKAAKRFGHGPAAEAAATVSWENRVELMKGHAAKKAAAAPAPAPKADPAPVPTGGRITPTAQPPRAAVADESPEDEFVRKFAATEAFKQFARR